MNRGNTAIWHPFVPEIQLIKTELFKETNSADSLLRCIRYAGNYHASGVVEVFIKYYYWQGSEFVINLLLIFSIRMNHSQIRLTLKNINNFINTAEIWDGSIHFFLFALGNKRSWVTSFFPLSDQCQSIIRKYLSQTLHCRQMTWEWKVPNMWWNFLQKIWK